MSCSDILRKNKTRMTTFKCHDCCIIQNVLVHKITPQKWAIKTEVISR